MPPKTFPILEITGSHRELGHAIGETFREKIRDVMERKSTTESYRNLITHIDEHISVTVKSFPTVIDELEGIAEASGTSFRDLFFHNIESLTDPAVHFTREHSETVDHCTAIVSWDPEGHPIVGHNEDWDKDSIDELYILKATIGDTTTLGLNYAAYLPGVSATLNSHGLVQCINEIPQFRLGGVPKNVIARVVSQCKTLSEAEETIKNSKHASGYNHVLVQDLEIRDIEIGGNAVDVERIFGQPYTHTNHYISDKLKKFELDTARHHKHSRARLERAREMLRVPTTVQEIADILSDRTNTKYPICRLDATIGSVIITPHDRTVRVCYGPPDTGTYIPYTL